MKRRLIATLTLFLAGIAGVHADVTVTNTITISGPIGQMMGGGATPQMTMKIKGSKARMDMEVMGQRTSTITDMDSKELIMLNHGMKTAQLTDFAQLAAKSLTANMPKMDAKVEPTGKTQDISGRTCAEYRYSMNIDMANFAANMGGARGQQMPPGAADMFKDVKMVMSGSMWVTKDGPGVAEYVAFSTSAMKGMQGMSPFGGSMPGAPGMDEMMKAFSQLEGMPMLSEIEMTFEGTSPMIDMMKAMGPMKITTKLTDISTEPVPDDLFHVPADYTMTKQ